MTETSWAQLWYDVPLAVIDVETTGFDPETDRIIEIGIVHFLRGECIEKWGQLVNPGCEIPEAVVNLTGIRDSDVANAPAFEAVAAEVATRLEGRGIVAYNLPFDRKFIRAELTRAGHAWPDKNPTFDPLILTRHFFDDMRSKKLGKVAERMGIDLVEAHRAVDDATTAGYVLYAFRDRLPPRLEEMQLLQAQWEQQQAQDTRHWRNKQPRDDSDWMNEGGATQTVGLGPAFVYGDEADPLRAFFRSFPEAQRT